MRYLEIWELGSRARRVKLQLCRDVDLLRAQSKLFPLTHFPIFPIYRPPNGTAVIYIYTHTHLVFSFKPVVETVFFACILEGKERPFIHHSLTQIVTPTPTCLQRCFMLLYTARTSKKLSLQQPCVSNSRNIHTLIYCICSVLKKKWNLFLNVTENLRSTEASTYPSWWHDIFVHVLILLNHIQGNIKNVCVA